MTRPVRTAAAATALCWLGFAALWTGATLLYPGGNWIDRTASGSRFFANFLCDFTQPVSLSGAPNPVGSRLAQAGMLLFAGALFGLFWLVPRHFTPGARLGVWVRTLGTLSVVILVAVPLTPSLRYGELHAWLSLGAVVLGILASLGAVTALFASDRRARVLALLGASALAVGAFDAVIFVRHWGDSAPPPLLVPAAQKVTAVLVSAWIGAVALLGVFDDDSEQGRR